MKTGRKSRWPVVLAGLVVAAALGTWAVKNLVFVVRDIWVEGNNAYTAEDVMRMSGIRSGQRMDEIAKTVVESRLCDTGRLELVEMEKIYPSTVSITVSERKTVGAVSHVGNLVLVDEKGVVMDEVKTLPEGQTAVYVSGADVSLARTGRKIETIVPAQAKGITACLTAIAGKNAFDYIAEVNVSDPDNLFLYSRTGIKVLLGTSKDMEDKIVWMMSAVDDLESRGEMSGTLDISSTKQAIYKPNVS